jgi:hypothetical protein
LRVSRFAKEILGVIFATTNRNNFLTIFQKHKIVEELFSGKNRWEAPAK